MRTKEEIITQIKDRGERMTMPRQAVIDALCFLGGHQTMQTIQGYLVDEHIDMPESTVYRVLQWLKDLGLVAQTDLGKSGITYELISTPPHHHLVCLVCNKMQKVDDTIMMPLREHMQNEYGFLPRIDHMAFFGICQECQSKLHESEDEQ